MDYTDLCLECYRSLTEEEMLRELEKLEDDSFDLAEEIANKREEYEQLWDGLKELLNNLDHHLSEIHELPVEVQPYFYPLRDDLNKARREVSDALSQCEKHIKNLKGVSFEAHNWAIVTLNNLLCQTPNKNNEEKENSTEKISKIRRYWAKLKKEGEKNPLSRWWGFIVMFGSLILSVLLLLAVVGICEDIWHVLFSQYLLLPVALFVLLYIAYFGIFGGIKILTVNHTCAKQVIIQTIGLIVPFALVLIAAWLEFISNGSAVVSYFVTTIPPIILILFSDKLKKWLCNTKWQRIMLTVTITIAMLGSIFTLALMISDIENMVIIYHIGYALAFLIPAKLLIQKRTILGCFSFVIPFVFMCLAVALTEGGVIFVIEVIIFAAITFALIKFLPLIKIKKHK